MRKSINPGKESEKEKREGKINLPEHMQEVRDGVREARDNRWGVRDKRQETGCKRQETGCKRQSYIVVVLCH